MEILDISSDDYRPNEIPVALYEKMFAAYVRNQSASSVARSCGVNRKTAQRYITQGCRRRHLPSLESRFRDAQEVMMARQREEASLILIRRLSQVRLMMKAMEIALIDRAGLLQRGYEHHASPQNWSLLLREEERLTDRHESGKSDGRIQEAQLIDFSDPKVMPMLVQKISRMQRATIQRTIRNIVTTLDPDGSLNLVGRLSPRDREFYDNAAKAEWGGEELT